MAGSLRTKDAFETVVAECQLILGFKGTRAGRAVFHDAPYQAQADSIARTAAPMRGTTRLLFANRRDAGEAYVRAKAAFESIGTGRAHVLTHSGDNQVYSAWPWMLDGDLSIELDEKTQATWIVSFAWRAIS